MVTNLSIYVNHINLLYMIAEIWRVVLKGESKDYIHASFAHVRAMNSVVVSSLHLAVKAFIMINHPLEMFTMQSDNYCFSKKFLETDLQLRILH